MQSNFCGSEKAFSVVINCSGAVLFLTCLLGVFWGCFMLTIWFFNPKYRIFIPNKTHNILILLTHSIGLETRSHVVCKNVPRLADGRSIARVWMKISRRWFYIIATELFNTGIACVCMDWPEIFPKISLKNSKKMVTNWMY